MSRVSGAARLRDGLAIALLAGGAVTFGFAASVLRDMGAGRVVLPAGQSYIATTERYVQISRGGVVAIVAGLGVGVWSYRRHRTASRSPRP